MRKIITHKSCDLDAISSVWLIKRFLPGWEDAEVEFVNAGSKLEGKYENENQAIEIVDGVETIHVDTGLGPLDHHQTSDNNTCGASLTFDFVLKTPETTLNKHENKREAVRRIVELVIDDDHFQEVYFPDASSDIYEAGIVGILHGYKILHRGEDKELVEFGFELLDDIAHNLEAKIWAENELEEKGVEFHTKWGKAIAVETINDDVLKVAQMKGFAISVRKDATYGYIRIKALPDKRIKRSRDSVQSSEKSLGIDLTPVYEKLKEMDPEANWYLHVSKRMLLNGSSKNPEMAASKLSLAQIIEVLKEN
jgi:hypothetical protein